MKVKPGTLRLSRLPKWEKIGNPEQKKPYKLDMKADPDSVYKFSV